MFILLHNSPTTLKDSSEARKHRINGSPASISDLENTVIYKLRYKFLLFKSFCQDASYIH